MPWDNLVLVAPLFVIIGTCVWFYSDGNEQTKLKAAIQNENLITLQKLFEKHEPNMILGTNTPLILAIQGGKIRAVETILSCKGQPNFKGLNGLTPLSWAVLTTNSEIAKILLKGGASPNATNVDGSTALSISKGSPQFNSYFEN